MDVCRRLSPRARWSWRSRPAGRLAMAGFVATGTETACGSRDSECDEALLRWAALPSRAALPCWVALPWSAFLPPSTWCAGRAPLRAIAVTAAARHPTSTIAASADSRMGGVGRDRRGRCGVVTRWFWAVIRAPALATAASPGWSAGAGV